MTTKDTATCFNATAHCSNTSACATASCQQHQQLSPPPSLPMSPASSVVSDSSMSSVDNSDSDPEDEEQRSRIQVTYMRPGCIEEHIIRSRTLAAAKVAAAAAAASGSTAMEH